MARQAIIERVWSAPKMLGIPRGHLEKSLEAAGFFELLQAAEKATRDVGICEECIARLDAAIAKAKGTP